MRPLDKGTVPLDIHGNPIIVTEYDNWRLDLIKRIGYYCAYCNQPLSHSLQVEHVIPKNPPVGYVPGAALDWDNMLLACGPCNNAKDNTPTNPNTYYLPEEHNTHLPFAIVIHNDPEHAIVKERIGLNPAQHTKAHDTIGLLKLDDIDNRRAVVDIRSLKRRTTIFSVESARKVYDMAVLSATYNANVVAEDIAKRAKESGFFSLWYEEFKNEPLVMEKLTDNSIIKGTATNCFDAANGYQPISRNPHNLPDPI